MSVLPVSNVCLCFLFLFLSAPSSHSLSFLGTPLRSSPMTSSIRTRATTTMLVAPSGSDSFPQILTSESPTASRIRTLPTPLRKMANVAAVPLAGAVGATLGAGGGVIGRVVFGAASAIGGAYGRGKFLDLEKDSALGALASLLSSKGVDDVTPSMVESIGAEYGFNGRFGEREFGRRKEEIYKRFLLAQMKSPGGGRSGDVKELMRLKEVLGLGGVEIGRAHYEASAHIYRDHVMWTSSADLSDPASEDRKKVNRILYLSDRLFRQCEGDNEEAYKYEMGRVAKVFGLEVDAAEVEERILDVSSPFYSKALRSARDPSKTITSEMLLRARRQLGISDTQAARMHMETYVNEIKTLLVGVGADAGKDATDARFPPDGGERLSELRGVLGLGSLESEKCLEGETTPLYRLVVSDVLDSACAEDPNLSNLVGRLAVKKSELLITDDQSSEVIRNSIQRKLNDVFEQACQYARVQNEQDSVAALRDIATVKSQLTELLEKLVDGSGSDDDVSETYFASGSLGGSADAGSNKKERATLYRYYLTDLLQRSDNKLDEDAKEDLANMSHLLGVGKFEAELMLRDTVGPMVKEQLEVSTQDIAMLGGDAASAKTMKEKNEELIEDLNFPRALAVDFGRDIYQRRLVSASEKSPSGVLTQELSDGLKALREFLDLEESDTTPFHFSVCGPAYKQSVLEAMGTTGVIPQNVREGLAKLRDRLRLNESDAARLYNSAVASKLAPMVTDLVTVLKESQMTQEQKDQLAKERGEDAEGGGTGEMGIGASVGSGDILDDCMNLIKFYDANDIAIRTQVGVETREKKVMVEKEVQQSISGGAGLLGEEEEGEEADAKAKAEGGKPKTEMVEEVVTEEVPVYTYEYPIQANKLGVDVEDKELEALYRQFIVAIFTTKDAKRARVFEENAEKFGSILGFDGGEMEKIKGSIGATIYENYISSAMTNKNELDQQDMMFLASIQDKLKMGEAVGERLMVETQKTLLNRQLEKVFTAGTKITAEQVKAVREQSVAMGIELSGDLGIDGDRLGRMFTLELESGIEDGSLTPDTASETIIEIQESLGLSVEKAQTLLGNMITMKSKILLQNISSDVIRGNDIRAVEDTFKLINFCNFVDADSIDLEIGTVMAEKIVNVFAAAKDSTSPEVESLRKVLM